MRYRWRMDRFRRLEESAFDVIVVGAGMGGLTAAALLCRRGKRVLVVDRHYAAGGNATIFKRKGYEFDVGIHYIGGCEPRGPIARTLDAAGATGVEFEELDPDGFDTLVFPDLRFRVPRGLDEYHRRLVEHFPDERRGIDRYVAFLEQFRRVQRIVRNPVSALWTLPRAPLVVRYANSTFAHFLDSCTSNERLRAVLAGQQGDYAQPPSRASALVAIGLTHHYLDGAFFPKGGGQVLADALAASIERHGGRILLRATARRIVVEGGRVRGVVIDSPHLGERTVTAPVVISNADLKRTLGELVGAEHLRPRTVQKARGYEMSPALGMVYLGLNRDLVAEGHPRTNYWIYPSYESETGYAATMRGEFPDEPMTYVSIGSVKDPTNRRMAPPGHTNLEVMSLAPSAPEAWGVSEADAASGAYRKSAEYQRRKQRYADRLLAMAERVLPGLRGQIAYQEVATPLTHARFTLATAGTSYGIALTPAQMLMGRPGATTEIAGLYLAGASTRTAHGIGGVMSSGVVAASAIVGGAAVKELFAESRIAAAVHGAATAAAR